MQQVYLNDIEITKFITDIPAAVQSAGDYGQPAINDIASLTGNNRLGFWDVTAQQSPFFGFIDLSQFAIKIETDDVITYQGFIQGIIADNQKRIATINLKSELQTALDKGIVYASAETDTAANLAKEIASLYKIPIDNASFANSNEVYNLNKISMSAFFKGESTVLDAIQQIAEIGIARIFNSNGKLFFDVFRTKTVPFLYTFTDDSASETGVNLFSHPKVEPLEKEKIEGYKVEWVGGIGGNTATLGTEQQQGKTISAGYSNPVRIMTLQSAIFIGEQWLVYLNLPQKRVTWDGPISIGKSLSIGTTIKLEYRDRESLILDIISIDNSKKVASTFIGLTR